MNAEQTELKQLLESRFPIVLVETAELANAPDRKPG